LGHYDSVFVSPVFPSISKHNFGPTGALPEARLRGLLSARTTAQRRTTVFALGGITAANASRCGALGFDGVAVRGAIWQSDSIYRLLLPSCFAAVACCFFLTTSEALDCFCVACL
jgi:thiamine-phosphate pyrophosphorylase